MSIGNKKSEQITEDDEDRFAKDDGVVDGVVEVGVRFVVVVGGGVVVSGVVVGGVVVGVVVVGVVVLGPLKREKKSTSALLSNNKCQDLRGGYIIPGVKNFCLKFALFCFT